MDAPPYRARPSRVSAEKRRPPGKEWHPGERSGPVPGEAPGSCPARICQLDLPPFGSNRGTALPITRGMSAPIQSRRTLTLSPEVAKFAAMIVLPGTTDPAAHRTRFPRLTVEPPFALSQDEEGWLRVTLVDPRKGRSETSYLRADW